MKIRTTRSSALALLAGAAVLAAGCSGGSERGVEARPAVATTPVTAPAPPVPGRQVRFPAG
jgi:hypothetical protein